MSAGALHSDHVNYLILRYLQESGHENAAAAFYRDWHRPRDHRDPETLPFAPAVRRHELISVIQEGLRHDELVARVAREQRRFRWTLDTISIDTLENGVTTSRPSSSGKRKPRTPHVRATDDFPTPAPKRRRRSEGPESNHVNGDHDVMDVDRPSPSQEVDEDAENGSPAVGSEGDTNEPPLRYDSVAIQTDVKPQPQTSTMYLKIDKPGSSILHSAWNPDTDSSNSRTLLTVGESLCRFYEIPKSQGATEISHVDYPCLPTEFIVTAAAWHPSGRTATCAVDSITTGPDGRTNSEQKIIDHSRDHGSGSYGVGPKLFLSPGIVLCLRYSPRGDYLLVARTNLKRGSIQVWRTPRPENSDYIMSREPVAWRIFEYQILDACWVGDDNFLVSGNAGLSTLFRLDLDAKTTADLSAETIMMQGLEQQQQQVVSLTENWDRVRFDETLNLAVFLSTDARKLLPKFLASAETAETKDDDVVIALTGNVTAAAFQPKSKHPVDDALSVAIKSSLLAVAFEEGHTIIYRVSHSSSGVPLCEELASLVLSDGGALALSWSPDGRNIAVGGTGLVQIWSVDSFIHSKARTTTHEPVVSWQPDSAATGESGKNGEMNGDMKHDLTGPSLSWSVNGESLAFAVDKQLAIIKFVPPFASLQQNGIDHGSVQS